MGGADWDLMYGTSDSGHEDLGTQEHGDAVKGF